MAEDENINKVQISCRIWGGSLTMNTTQSEEYDEYVRRKVWRPFLTDSSRNYKEESKTWKSFSQEKTLQWVMKVQPTNLI